MILFEIIIEGIAYALVEIVYEKIVCGTYNFIKFDILGFERTGIINQKNKLENKFLYKNVELIKQVNEKLQIGQKGTILEIIDNKFMYAEFYDNQKNQIEFENEIAFKISVNQFKLLK
jgi:hypothetical protein